MNNNKILTVSYGTFSCTLEGFEDSFEMMKVIAEYFRDLAAEDRFFGAEPAQLDPDMLAKLAQGKTSAPVDASEHDGHVVLSAGAAVASVADATASNTDADDMYEDDVYDTGLTTEASFEEDALEETGFEKMEAAAMPAGAPAAGSIAEKLQRIRAVVQKADANVEDEPFHTNALTNDASADEEELDDGLDFVSASTDDIMAVAEEIEPELDDYSEEAIEETEEEEIDVVEDALAALDAAGAIDDEAYEEDVAVEDAMSADANAELTEAFEDDSVGDGDLDDGDVAEEGVLVLDTPATDEIEAQDDSAEITIDDVDVADTEIEDIAEFDENVELSSEGVEELSEPLNVVSEEKDAAEVETATEDAAVKDDLSHILDALADDASTDHAEPADTPASDEDPANDVLKLISQIETSSDDASDETATPSDDQVAEETGAEQKRVRVIKVKRTDIEDAVMDGTLELTPDQAVANDDIATSSLSQEDEAELMAELAEVDAIAEDLADNESDTMQTEEDAIEQMMGDAADTLPALADTEEDADAHDAHVLETDVNRLMDEAEEQMDEPESAKRRSAFQALKAAVLARKADKQLSSDDDDGEDVDAYRSDLAKVVQPRRPDTESATRTERPAPAELQSAPLRLVAEQRVGTDEETPVEGPVTPRRVASEDATPTAEAGSFVDYCAELGAHDLSDVLEAAASYLTFIEGRKQFSRPQLMMKARQIEKEDFSREDGLRSFGQLLRSGKIEKIRGGRFAVTPDIGYKPDQRAAG